MKRSLLTIAMAVVALTAWFANFAAAADAKVHDGVVVSATTDKLVMKDKDGTNEHKHTIGPAVTVTIDGKEAKITDLRKDQRVRVTQDDAGKVTKVEASK
jgi:hypothetical protein